MSFTSPRAFRTALNTAAQRTARADGRDVGALLQQYYLARLMARVFHDDPDGWLLKGGQAMLVRYTHARHSRDIDLIHTGAGEPDMDSAVDALRRAAALDLGDFLRFAYLDTTEPSPGASGRTVRFTPYLGTTKLTVLSVDLVVDHLPLGLPVTRPLEPVLSVEGIGVWPDVRLYPLVDHLADKIAAMLERHGASGAASSRYRDLVDLLLIIGADTIDGAELHAILRLEVRRRTARGISIELPERFAAPDPATWEAGYRGQAAGVAGLEDYRALAPAVASAATFIDPLLSPSAPGTWDPAQRRWLDLSTL